MPPTTPPQTATTKNHWERRCAEYKEPTQKRIRGRQKGVEFLGGKNESPNNGRDLGKERKAGVKKQKKK